MWTDTVPLINKGNNNQAVVTSDYDILSPTIERCMENTPTLYQQW